MFVGLVAVRTVALSVCSFSFSIFVLFGLGGSWCPWASFLVRGCVCVSVWGFSIWALGTSCARLLPHVRLSLLIGLTIFVVFFVLVLPGGVTWCSWSGFKGELRLLG